MDWTSADISNLCNRPNFEKVQDKPACNPERQTAMANKVKVKVNKIKSITMLKILVRVNPLFDLANFKYVDILL